MNAIGFSMEVDQNPNWTRVMGMELLRGVKTGDFDGQWLNTSRIGKTGKKDVWTWKLPLAQRLRELAERNEGKTPCSMDLAKIEAIDLKDRIEKIRINLKDVAIKSKARKGQNVRQPTR